jgi:hypothetical protein
MMIALVTPPAHVGHWLESVLYLLPVVVLVVVLVVQSRRGGGDEFGEGPDPLP